MSEMPKYSKKDFVSDQAVRWCPGCGDYSILAAVQLVMPKIGVKKEDIVFVAGIGCSSRFPYYMNTYGMHTIHGRAPAFATGLKVANPDLSVWVITGDGDGLSIGGNQTIHAVRRNVDVNIILFNNEIYGLTKGQYSPTSKIGSTTKSTPMGSVDRPFDPANLALGAGATFFARTMDTDPKHMQEIFLRAANHKGTSFVEVLQNCVIFNDATHDYATNRTTKKEHTVNLEHGKPLLFGKDNEKAIGLKNLQLCVGEAQQFGGDKGELLIHDERSNNDAYWALLNQLKAPDFPVPLGVLREVEAPVYEQGVSEQIQAAQSEKGAGDMQKLLESGSIWTVES